MAHWAEINDSNEVIRITVGDNNDPNGDEGYQWLLDNLGGTWIKCSYNATIRNKYPALGDLYSEEHDAFIEPRPFTSWTFNASTLQWDAPVDYPNDGKAYGWDEENLKWIELDRSNSEAI